LLLGVAKIWKFFGLMSIDGRSERSYRERGQLREGSVPQDGFAHQAIHQ
jgi:hypothetical protein